jgi:hypothetical protein
MAAGAAREAFDIADQRTTIPASAPFSDRVRCKVRNPAGKIVQTRTLFIIRVSWDRY